MFEGTLVESRGLVGTGTARWTALGSMTVQCAVAALLIAIPLLRPEALPMLSDAPKLTVPLAPKPPVPVVRVQTDAASSSSAMSAPAASAVATNAMPSLIPHIGPTTDGPAPAFDPNLRMGVGGPGGLAALAGADVGPSVAVVKAKLTGPVRVSTGVSAGLLLTEIRPMYPAIARAARVEGAVVMEATISKEGRIESLRAVSGPEMLRGAALQAVQAARYAPYRLNGEATEVQTTITVNFRLGS